MLTGDAKLRSEATDGTIRDKDSYGNDIKGVKGKVSFLLKVPFLAAVNVPSLSYGVVNRLREAAVWPPDQRQQILHISPFSFAEPIFHNLQF